MVQKQATETVRTAASKAIFAQEVHQGATDAKALWKDRNAVWSEDRAMLQQSYKQRLAGYETVLSNEPRTQFDLAVAILAGQEPIWTLPITIEDPDERHKMNKVERFVRGVMTEADKRWRKRGHNSWLWEYIWYTCGGAFSVFPHIEASGTRGLEFKCDIYDPMTVYPIFGDDGTVELYRVYKTTRSMAETMAMGTKGFDASVLMDKGKERSRKSTDTVDVFNRWWMDGDRAMNAVVIDGIVVKDETHHDEFAAIPIKISPANGTPYRQYDDTAGIGTASYQATWGRSLVDANRQHYKDFDRLLSYIMENAKDHAYPTGIDINEQGTLTISNKDTGKMKWVARQIGEDLKYLQPPQMPPEIGQMLTYFMGAIQRGGLSHVAFGTLGMEISGVTLEQLLVATRSKLLPYKDTAESGLEEIAMEFMDQFRRKRRKVALLTRKGQQGSIGQMLYEDFSQDDIPAHMPITAELPMSLPSDLLQRVTIARQLIPSGKPLADLITVQEDILKFQDKEMIATRIAEDQADDNPISQAAKTANALKRKASAIRARATNEDDLNEARTLEIAADVIMKELGEQLGMNPGGANSAGSTRIQPEPSPQAQPPEGRPNSPQAFRNGAEIGGASRPAGPEDRLANMNLAPPREG